MNFVGEVPVRPSVGEEKDRKTRNVSSSELNFITYIYTSIQYYRTKPEKTEEYRSNGFIQK